MRRKTSLAAAIIMAVLLFPIISLAQKWTWEGPYPLENTYVEIAASPLGGDLYGVTPDGGIEVIDVSGVTPSDSVENSLADTNIVRDMAVVLGRLAFLCTETGVKYSFPISTDPNLWSSLDPQPPLPSNDGTNPLDGAFTNISVGVLGRLYVLFTASGGGSQYLLVGTPSFASEGVTIRFVPRTLNLASRGRWVRCFIELPEGMDEADILTDTVQITHASIAGVGEFDLDPAIGVAPGATTKMVAGRLMVKFIRYDRENPENPQSLTYRLNELLSGQTGKFYQVTLTVKGQLSSGEWFEGTDTIRVKKANKKGSKTK